MWAHSEKSTYFKEKCWLCRPFEISWNFNIFSKVTNFLQTCRTYWNHHQKHACEIWAHKEKLTYFIEKCLQCRSLKYHKISLFFQSSPAFIKLSKFFGIIIRNMHVKCEPIQRSQLISRKCWLCRPFEISWNFNIFSKVTNFLQTCRTYWNHHQKHACEIWAYSEKLIFSYKNAYTAGPSNYHEISTFFQSAPNFIKLAEFIGIIIRNMHAKFEPIQRSLLVS